MMLYILFICFILITQPALNISSPIDAGIVSSEILPITSDGENDVKSIDNWTGLKKIFVVSPTLDANWHEAQRTCAFNHMHLATVNNQKENDEVQRVMKKHGVSRLWIGATDLANRGRFYWMATGACLGEYTNWAVGEPNNNGTERCVHARDDGGWNNADCDEELHFACEKYERVGEAATGEAACSPLSPKQSTTTALERATPIRVDRTEEPATTIRTKRMKKVFYLSDIRADWREAARLCASNGTRLATVRNEQENDEMTALIYVYFSWIGASDLDEEVHFTWGTNDPLTYTNWIAGEPNHSPGVRECVMMMPGGQWFDYYCTDEVYFACEAYEEE